MSEKINVSNRGFLIDLREAAENQRSMVPNRNWRRAYKALAMAADHCDAILARCSDQEDE